MPALVRFLALCCIASLAACTALPTQKPGPHPAPLILISIDGFRADYIDRGAAPTLARLAAEGVHAQAMRPAFPSLTFPNHYTLATGLYPDHHGIVHNIMRDPQTDQPYKYNDRKTTSDPKWWGGEPIWVGAERHGIRAATMFWPGTDVAIDGVRPSHWMPYDGHVNSDRRVDAVLRWFDLPPRERPGFFTLYFDQLDHAGHDFGPDTPEATAAIATVDQSLARLMAGLNRRGLANKVNLVIVSDHGMVPVPPDHLVFMDDLMDVNAANFITTGILAGMRPSPENEPAIAKFLLAPHDHFQCWRKEDMPARFHYGTNPRIPPLLCLVETGWTFATHDWVEKKKGHMSKGEHGYDNDAPEMRALFVAHGPAFKQGLSVPEFDNVNVYPLLTHLLGIPAAPNDGDPAVTAPMLRDAAD